jgi:glutamate-1-semialdehyde 2,1-aminomutase
MTKNIAIVQGRMNSTRLVGKVMEDINGHPAIFHTLTRVRRATTLDEVWLACTENALDNPLADYAEKLGFPVFRGDEHDVLDRFAALANLSDADVIARITGDCPAVEPELIDTAIARLIDSGCDYVSNHLVRTFPDGLDVEVFTHDALARAHREATHEFSRMHVTPYIHGRLQDRIPWGNFATDNIVNPVDFSHIRWTLDEPEDLLLLQRLFAALPENFHWLEAIAAMTRDPELFWINRKHKLHAGSYRDLGDTRPSIICFDRSNQQFARASESIPLASQTFSKSFQQWSAGATPLFIESGHGCRVKDIDGNVFIDYVQGLMPNILGYCDPDVDSAIRHQLDRGITFSLATTLEADLAERLVRDIPCAEMVRFGKNGSDATTAAIRLARAHTGRDRIAVGGYHGWHDWYIGSTVRNCGVPEIVSGLTSTFPFNDADVLAKILADNPDGYAAIILEPTGATLAEAGFLERVRALADQYGVVLVFDEIVTGFRIHRGGAQALFGVTPDLACYGKAMANGMPISAVVGKKTIMMQMEHVFVSGTFGGEALSIVAAIATIDKISEKDVIRRLWTLGDRLMESANALFERHGFGGTLAFGGQGWWPRLTISEPPIDMILMMTLLRQAFVAKGLLLASSFNLSLAHDAPSVIEETLDGIDSAMSDLRSQLDSSDPAQHLRGQLIQPTFSVR